MPLIVGNRIYDIKLDIVVPKGQKVATNPLVSAYLRMFSSESNTRSPRHPDFAYLPGVPIKNSFYSSVIKTYLKTIEISNFHRT